MGSVNGVWQRWKEFTLSEGMKTSLTLAYHDSFADLELHDPESWAGTRFKSMEASPGAGGILCCVQNVVTMWTQVSI